MFSGKKSTSSEQGSPSWLCSFVMSDQIPCPPPKHASAPHPSFAHEYCIKCIEASSSVNFPAVLSFLLIWGKSGNANGAVCRWDRPLLQRGDDGAVRLPSLPAFIHAACFSSSCCLLNRFQWDPLSRSSKCLKHAGSTEKPGVTWHGEHIRGGGCSGPGPTAF